jgi:hypothetical protein
LRDREIENRERGIRRLGDEEMRRKIGRSGNGVIGRKTKAKR